ncbi:MAG: cytochrome c biogenesis protein CcdA [Thermomicrobiales bacterium]|nr:cytochrome c biogenesis protein CcdA [Thermomicrobiales bacterium]
MATLSPRSDQPALWRATVGTIGLAAAALIVIVALTAMAGRLAGEPELASNLIALAIPALLAGVFSVLSPCSLPIVLGYFSVAFQEEKERIGIVTLAFLGGVGITMTVLGASFTALGSFAIEQQELLATIGGVLVIGFGVMSILGKGFGGMTITRRSGFGAGPAFLYGLVFALGWTTCVGPILGSILTLLIAQGATASTTISLVAGGALSLIYVLGLGVPIMLLVLALRSGGDRGSIQKRLRGRGFEVRLGSRTLYLHTTSLISGLLLIALGVLLITGQMTRLSEQLAASRFSQWLVELEQWLPGV